MAEEKHNIRLSKALSWLLRHNLHLVTEISRNPVDPSGFVEVSAVLQLPRFSGYSIRQVEEVVAKNDKQRFTLKRCEKSGKLLIRANQGHSVPNIDPDLTKLEEPFEVEQVIHGTYEKHWRSISHQGLSRMNRNHIHFAKGLPNDQQVISGMRQDCNLLIYVHLPTAIAAGFDFFESANGVILCPGDKQGFLPPSLFAKVVHKKKGREVQLQST